MSKAFLRESDFEDSPEPPRLAAALPFGAKNYLTPAGAQRLRDELLRLTEVERPPLALNPDDADARRALKVLDQRIRHLQASLRSAVVVAAEPGPHDTVRFGATVTVREPDGSEARYRIVGVDETDASRNWISWQSPLARTLLQAKVGDRVAFQAPRHRTELEIVAVEFEE